MKAITSVLFAALCIAGPAIAAPADEMAGTWECRLPGVEYGRKPPILYVGEAPAKDSSQPIAVDLDGFAREVYGLSSVAPDADGWFKVTPAQGQPFLVRPDAAAKTRTAAMALRLTEAGGTYRCLRLPPPGTPASS
jgi:hypothetical protein